MPIPNRMTLMTDTGSNHSNNKPKKTNKLNGGTFLGVRPETVSNEINKGKTAGQLRAAEIFKAANNAVIAQNTPTTFNNTFLTRSENTKKLSNINSSVNKLFKYSTAADTARANLSKINPVQAGGQFGQVRSDIEKFNKGYEAASIVDYAKNAAKADTTKDVDVYNFYNKRRVNQQFHDEAIASGQWWISDERKYTDWILSAPTQEEANARIAQAQEYMDRVLHEVPTYDAANHSYSTQLQFREDAELPPWIQPTSYNISLWRYYTTYSHDVVQSAADAYNEARDFGREYTRNPYKSAFAGAETGGQVDSFLDVLITSFDNKGFDSTYDKLLLNTISYIKDYYWNPLKAGKLKTAAGNALWNLMDTMDIAARGVRGFVAGDTVLGGSGGIRLNKDATAADELHYKNWEKYGYKSPEQYERNKNHGVWERINDAKFRGQNVYWAKIEGHTEEEIQRAQTLFMDHGGYELLLSAHPDFATKAQLGSGDLNISDSERAKIIKELDQIFKGSDISWRDIYKDIDKNYFIKDRSIQDVKQGAENVKKAYSDVDANFYANTGSLMGDIILETVLDPGIMVGGLSRSVAKNGVQSAAEHAVREGFINAVRNVDYADAALKSKDVQLAIRKFIIGHEGKNIIFKDAKKIDEGVELFIKELNKHSNLLVDESSQKLFKNTITSQLLGKQKSVNGMIIASQNFAKGALDNKTFKSAYYMSKAIDHIDSTIIKSAFFLPWAGVKGAKAGFHGAVNVIASSEALRKVAARLKLDNSTAIQLIADKVTKKVDVTKMADLMDAHEAGLIKEASTRDALRHIVDQYDNVTWNINDIIRKFSRGELAEEEVFRTIGDLVHEITGGKYRYVQELQGYIDNLDVRYAGDVKSAYGRLNDTFVRLQNLVEHRSEKAVEGFLDKVRQAQDVVELKRLFRENMDNTHIMALGDEVINNSQLELTIDELEQLKNEVRLGLFTEESINKETIEKAVAAQKSISKTTIDRTVGFNQFDEILQKMGVTWRTGVPSNDRFGKKMMEFMRSWEADDITKRYDIDAALKYVDRLERQIHFGELLDLASTSEFSALDAHKLIGQFNKLRKNLKKVDLISLKDVKYVVLPQMDLMAYNLEFRNSADIQKAYGAFYDDVIAPIWDTFKGKTTDEIDLIDSSLFNDIDELAKQKYGFDRTSQLIDQVKTLPGFSDEHLHSFITTLATDFKFRDMLGDIDLAPGVLRRKLEATLRGLTGDSKLGMKSITDSLESVNSDAVSSYMKPYMKAFEESPELKTTFNKIIQKDVLDPTAYVEKQMLFTALADPAAIKEWNALAARGQTPIFMHINTTGLNSEINSLTSISFRKWVPISETDDAAERLKQLLDVFDSEETTVFQRRMLDSELDEFTEQVIRQLDFKDCIPSSIKNRYKEIYGVTDGAAYKSESEIMEEACAYINSATKRVDENGALHFVAPTIVVHDLDGFNINYFNNKVGTLRGSVDKESQVFEYLQNVMYSAKSNSCNTYERLASKAGDIYYTDEQLDLITDILHDYIDDINYFAHGYRINDMRTYTQKMHSMYDRLVLKRDAGEITTKEADFLKRFEDADGVKMLKHYDNALSDITELGLYPRQFAYISDGLETNYSKAAIQAAGRSSVNVQSRIYIDDVLSYFNLATDDGFYACVEDLRKMHEMSQYIVRTRNTQIVAGAEEFLRPYKADFDKVIQSITNLSTINSSEATRLAYLQNIRIPDNAVDSYLIVKKIYNDHLKYWLDDDVLTSLRTTGKDLDAMKHRLIEECKVLGLDHPKFQYDKQLLFERACDYVNGNRVRFFDELISGGFDTTVGLEWQHNIEDVLDLLQGAHEPEIFKWAARSDFEKQVLSYKNGVMKYGLDKAAKYSEAGSNIKSEMRQLQHLDDYFTAAGIVKSQDRFTASIYTKANQLFDSLERTGLLKRASFHDFLQSSSELQRLHLQDYRLRALKNAEGEFDRTKMLSELVYNGFNMTVFNSHNYDPSEIRSLREFIKDLNKKGDDFISYYEDLTTGNVYVYLNDSCQVAEYAGARWINQKLRLERPVYDVVPFAEFDELASVLNIDNVEDFREVYSELLSCWEDTRVLSNGLINGTTGRTVSRRQAEEFLQSLPSNMDDWLTSEGLLRDELTRGVIYDPGFVINNESDMLTDFLDTIQRQAETVKDDFILINECFHSTGSVQFSDLARNFTTEELIKYFGENPEYVVCTIVENKHTATGFQVRQLNLSNRIGVETARTAQNTTILPYSVYYDLANHMNRTYDGSVYKQLLGKYLQVYKAFALVKPGTWMRNYIDATTKAAFDNGEGAGNIINMLQYQSKAARDIGVYGRIAQSDAKLLTPANWDLIQRTFKTDMTYEDFELLRGIMDSNRYMSAEQKYLRNAASKRGGFNIISGEDIGLRNLEEKDITKAFNKYLSKEADLPLSKNEFMDIYFKRVIPDDATNELYEGMFRKLSNNMRNANGASYFDKGIDAMFKPFGYVEELARYSQSLLLRDNGFSGNQITRHIHNTQFYTAPTWGAWNKLETIVPFITFKFNNIMYWVRMMDENPRLYRYYEDMYRSVYKTTIENALEEGVELDYSKDYGLQSGGIPINNGKYYLNMNTSLNAALNDFYGIPHDFDSLNPLFKDIARGSVYVLGLNSKQFFSDVDLDITDDDITKKVKEAIPGYTLAQKGIKYFNEISGISSETGGPTMQALYSTLNFLGVLGARNNLDRKDGSTSFATYLEELEAQWKWYDANLGKVVDISLKNEYGANDPNITFADKQTYMLIHFGKIWDANQYKFVTFDQYQPGGFNDGFNSWEDLQQYMEAHGKVWDYNQRKFVYSKDYISGGLNSSNLEWETLVSLMEEKFPNLKWDANQQSFVETRYYIKGGLNDIKVNSYQDFRELMAIRQALFGETYNKETKKFEKTGEPSIVMANFFMDKNTRKKYDNYYSLLAIPGLEVSDKKYHVNGEGLLVDEDGKYIITGNPKYDSKVFEKFSHTYDRVYYGNRFRQYQHSVWNNNRNYFYTKAVSNTIQKVKKVFKGYHHYNPLSYLTGYGWNKESGYYRLEYKFRYQYHNPQPRAKLNRLISPPKFYPYGGGYNKFSFHARV